MTTTLEVRSLSLQHVPASLDAKPEVHSKVPTPPRLEVKTEGITNVPSLKIESGIVTTVSSLQVQTESITNVPSLSVQSQGAAVKNPSPPQTEIKTEAVSTTGSGVTSPEQRSPDTGTTQVEHNGGFETLTQPIAAPSTDAGKMTGTGSITATPTSYLTAITTTASTTQQGQTDSSSSSLLPGKRVRKESSKCRQFEPLTVCHRDVCCSLILCIISACLYRCTLGGGGES